MVSLTVAGSLGLGYGTAHLLQPAATTVRRSAAPQAPVHAKAIVAARQQRHTLSGLASWYGDFFDGRQTASGEIFHQEEMTACHPTLPFGTLVRVVNLRNRRSVVVRITDRGLSIPHRVIDLSSGAAMKLGMLRAGVARVRLEVIDTAHG